MVDPQTDRERDSPVGEPGKDTAGRLVRQRARGVRYRDTVTVHTVTVAENALKPAQRGADHHA